MQHIDKYHFISIKNDTLRWVLVADEQASAALGIDVLHKIVSFVKDICGDATEERVKSNFVIVYEIVDEVFVCSFKTL